MSINNDYHTQFPVGEANIILPGPAGNLEVVTSMPNEARAITAIICHPHPLYEGTLHNKVVTTLARTFKELGIRTVRFNFRGVGKSEGSYGEGVGETEDTLAIVQWAHTVQPHDTIWLAGFSFGSYIAARTATLITPARLICIAPAVEHFDFTALPPIPCPWIVVQGEQDEVVPPEMVFTQLPQLPNPPEIIRMQGVGHYFHGRLTELRQILITALS